MGKRQSISFLALTLLISLLGVSVSEAEESLSWEAETGSGSSIFLPGSTDIWATEASENMKLPRLLAFDDWTQCWVFRNTTWSIASFTGNYFGTSKTLALKCGAAESSGYFHILDKHEAQWRSRITQADSSAPTDAWDDLMWFAAKSSWTDYDISVPQGSGKLCRSLKVDLVSRNKLGLEIRRYSFNPTFIWSLNNNVLITAIPSSSSAC